MTQKHARYPCHVPNTDTLGDRCLFPIVQKTKAQHQRTQTQKFSILLNYFLLLFQGNVASRERQRQVLQGNGVLENWGFSS